MRTKKMQEKNKEFKTRLELKRTKNSKLLEMSKKEKKKECLKNKQEWKRQNLRKSLENKDRLRSFKKSYKERRSSF